MRARHALLPIIGMGTDDDPYRPLTPAGLASWAASIPTAPDGSPLQDWALVHFWGSDDQHGEADASGVVFDLHHDKLLAEVPVAERRRWKAMLRKAGRETSVSSQLRQRHLVRAAGQVIEPWFHELNLRAGIPELAGGAALQDNFTGTSGSALTAHTSDSGHSWTVYTTLAAGPSLISNANRVRGQAGQGTCPAYSSYTPPSAEYDITWDEVYFDSTPCFSGVFGRLSTGADTSYVAFLRPDTATATLNKRVAGVVTTLGTFTISAQTYTGNTLGIRDATKKLFIGGTERISSTDNAVTGAGKVGLYLYQASDSTGVHTDNLQVTEVSTASVTSPALTGTVTLPAPTVTAGTTASVTSPGLTATVTLPAPTVASGTGATIIASASGIPIWLDGGPILIGTVTLPAPNVATTSGSSNATILATAATGTVRLVAPQVTGASITAAPLTATVTLPAPVVAISSSSNVAVAATAAVATVRLVAPQVTGIVQSYRLPLSAEFINALPQTAEFINALPQTADFVAGTA